MIRHQITFQFVPSEIIVRLSYLTARILFRTPSMVSDPYASIVIMPDPLFLTIKYFPSRPTAVGNVTVKVPVVQSTIQSVLSIVYALVFEVNAIVEDDPPPVPGVQAGPVIGSPR